MSSLRKVINQNCKNCIHDNCAAGTWLQQVTLCSVITCALYDVRPKTHHTIPGSVLSYYGIKSGHSQDINGNYVP